MPIHEDGFALMDFFSIGVVVIDNYHRIAKDLRLPGIPHFWDMLSEEVGLKFDQSLPSPTFYRPFI